MVNPNHLYTRRGDAAWLYEDDQARTDWIDATGDGDASARDLLVSTVGRAFHVRVLQEIARLSRDYPGLPLILTDTTATIPSSVPEGFDVSIQTEKGRHVVRLGKWRDEFALVSEAVALIEAALLGEIRLVVHGPREHQCIAEKRLLNGQWIKLPRHEGTEAGALPPAGTYCTKVLRNSYAGFMSHAASMALRAARGS